jgi:hypothetical protein
VSCANYQFVLNYQSLQLSQISECYSSRSNLFLNETHVALLHFLKLEGILTSHVHLDLGRTVLSLYCTVRIKQLDALGRIQGWMVRTCWHWSCLTLHKARPQ